jgi:outer membrane protein OmpA-like peptidoglycan-associated protein
MKRTYRLLIAGLATAALAGCASTPQTLDELETARAVVAQVEASPRAGVAATYVADARRSLDRANRLAEASGKTEDARYEAQLAILNAQIANEKILTQQAREEIDKGTAERQAVLIEAREREAQRRAMQAAQAQELAEQERLRASTLEQELAELKAKPTPRGMVVTLGDVLFDTGKATLKPGAFPTIQRVADALKNEPERRVTIEGHTDSVGSEELNLALSQRRADAVQVALLERGVAANQVSAVGKGEGFPVASNDDPGGRQRNRRVELIFAE